jgi:hypothetical protein
MHATTVHRVMGDCTPQHKRKTNIIIELLGEDAELASS